MTYSTNNEAKNSSSNYVSIHQMLATDASFIEEASHSAVQECAEDQMVSHALRREARKANLGQKGVPASKSGKAAKTSGPQKGGKTASSQAKGFSGSDVMVSSKGGASEPYSLQGKMQLPSPAASVKGNNVWTDGDLSIVAVLNSVLVACAKAGSEFWKNMWDQATQNMMSSLSLAKPIANAVLDQANAQADATQAEADMNKNDGMVNIGFAAVSYGWGLKESFFGKDEDPENFATKKIGAQPGEEAAGEAERAADNVAQEEQAAARNTQQSRSAVVDSSGKPGDSSGAATDKNAVPAATSSSYGTPSASATARTTSAGAAEQPANEAARAAQANDAVRANRGPVAVAAEAEKKPNSVWQALKGAFNRSSNFTSKVNKGFLKGFQIAQGLGMMAQGICGVAYDAPGKSKMATAQRAAGQYDAMSKEGEMISQFHNQAFSRGEDIRQGAQQQQIDTPLNVLKTAADTVTQAIMAQHV
jgi:hypothetical protein